MLTFEEVQQLNDFFKLTLDLTHIKAIQGGDVNETFIANSSSQKYIIKKIHIKEYTKDYHVTTDEILSSIRFSEHIAQQLVPTEHASSALFINQDCVLRTECSLFIIYPFIPGSVKENNAITVDMVKEIASFLSLIHHSTFSFDEAFAEKKISIFKNIGQEIINLSLWKKLRRFTHKTFFFPKLHKISEYLLINKHIFSEAIILLQGDTICHNDLKPKNVLWENQRHFAVIDWETSGLFDMHADYLDTILTWCSHYNENKIIFKKEKLQAFMATYPVPPADLKQSTALVFVKWYFWLAFCIKKLLQNPKQWKHYYWHIRYSIHFIIWLIDNDIVAQLESAQSANTLNE